MSARVFSNTYPHTRHGFRDVLRWKIGLGPRETSRFPEAIMPAARREVNRAEWRIMPTQGWRVAWLGHSSFFLAGHGLRLLIDPVFSNYCAPFPLYLPAFRRFQQAACQVADLPSIDAILLTHNHYDHCDLATLKQFPRETRIICAEGMQGWLTRKSFTNVTEVAWHASVLLEHDTRITATAAQHFSSRSFGDRNRKHWCGWMIEGAGKRLWHAGDSGYCADFSLIGERFGSIDLSMIPIGAYQPRWFMSPMHMDPAEAVQVFLDTRSERAIGMHWGTFRLTDEPVGEPPLLLAEALAAKKIDPARFVCGEVGEWWEL